MTFQPFNKVQCAFTLFLAQQQFLRSVQMAMTQNCGGFSIVQHRYQRSSAFSQMEPCNNCLLHNRQSSKKYLMLFFHLLDGMSVQHTNLKTPSFKDVTENIWISKRSQKAKGSFLKGEALLPLKPAADSRPFWQQRPF